MSNVLDLHDQAYFSFERAAKATNTVQCVWVYDRGVDLDGLRRFHRGLQRGLLSRRIERSPLPFGRHRWVAAARQPELDVAAVPRPREDFDAWLDEQAATRLDPEHGPGWRLAVLPFTDGGAGVSLVSSHCLLDGIGLCEAVAAAVSGDQQPLTWPAAGSRRRWWALAQDAGQSLRDIPSIGGAVIAAARFTRRRSTGRAVAPGVAVTEPDKVVTLSQATVFIDAEDWEARAADLGGTGNTLLAGIAARLAERVGRVTADGLATPSIPVSTRTAGDTRANAITNVDIAVDSTRATADLRETRAAIKAALTRCGDVPDERWALLPLVPLLPESIKRRVVAVATGGTTNVVSSNLGATPPALNRPDGSDADYFVMKSLYPDVTKGIMHRIGGVLALVSGRVRDQVFVSVLGYQPNRLNSNEQLRQDLSGVLDDFALTATRAWAPRSALTA